MAFGIILLVWSIYDMTSWTPDVAQWRIMLTITVQGAGLGFLFIPLQVLAFATLPGQYRTDGASLFSLFRNIGAAIGVSVTSSMLVHNTQVLHEEIGGSITPFNRALTQWRHGRAFLGPGDTAWRGDAGQRDQSAGADHRLCRRLPHDDLHHGADAAAVAADAALSPDREVARAGTDRLTSARSPLQAAPQHLCLRFNQKGR